MGHKASIIIWKKDISFTIIYYANEFITKNNDIFKKALNRSFIYLINPFPCDGTQIHIKKKYTNKQELSQNLCRMINILFLNYFGEIKWKLVPGVKRYVRFLRKKKKYKKHFLLVSMKWKCKN